jgi:hypothetical protein
MNNKGKKIPLHFTKAIRTLILIKFTVFVINNKSPNAAPKLFLLDFMDQALWQVPLQN